MADPRIYTSEHGGAMSHGCSPLPRRRRFQRPALAVAALLAVASVASLPLGGYLRLAFLPAPAPGVSRRTFAAEAALLLAAGPVAGARADQEPFPAFFLKDLDKSSDKIEYGTDWLYFELKPALMKEDQFRCREVLGGAISGSHISPITQNLLLPMEQLISGNIDAQEDGWVDAMKQLRDNMEIMSENVGIQDWKAAKANWEEARAGANKILTNINNRAPEPVFTLLDGEYDKKRAKLYLKGKKDMLSFRNQRGTLMLR